jgi:DNA-binding protein HU-beta
MFANRSIQVHRFRASLLSVKQSAASALFPFIDTSTSTIDSDNRIHQQNFSTVESSNKGEQRVNKSKIAEEIARNHDLSKDTSQRILNTVLDTIVEAVGDDRKVMLQNFGTFSSYMSKERMGVHPITREKISIPPKRRIRFKASEAFKNSSD